MRIAQVANFYGPRSGGLRTALHALGRGYVDAGDDVLLIVPGDEDREHVAPHGRVVTLHSPLVPGTGGYRAITRLGAVTDALEAFRPDALEVSDRTTLAGLGPWARGRGIAAAFVAHERVDGVLASALRGAAPRRVERLARAHTERIAARFETIVATTAYAGAELTAVGARVETVPLGVDLDRFHPRFASARTRRRHAPDEVPLLVLASRLSREKRPGLAIDAVRVLAARGRPVRLVVAGAGPLARPLRRAASGLPVELVGFVSDRAEFASLLASADVVIAPGPIETFGLAALEALASGTPVVVNAASALPEVVGEAGLAAAGTPEAFADAIEAMLARDGRDKRLAARARAVRFPWEATVARMRALHARALAGAR
ncbi:glycosyltransferase [Demequina sp. SYSU T00192]|uniref:D-inositol 3-phosphate glycosyltransferase n=1 Tax=Demequina litoralis TaxID=3051660 RepID=A0ABT8GBN9_9MICO|nr:glycosyltransferase [Demequina sp. SYSU T00192]MDN4476555.1 glycosyltransferase [Demequina sp. SYSU T00192]